MEQLNEMMNDERPTKEFYERAKPKRKAEKLLN